MVLHYRSDRGRVNALAQEIGEKDSLTVRGDLSKEKDMRAVFVGATRRFGRVRRSQAGPGDMQGEPGLLLRLIPGVEQPLGFILVPGAKTFLLAGLAVFREEDAVVALEQSETRFHYISHLIRLYETAPTSLARRDPVKPS